MRKREETRRTHARWRRSCVVHLRVQGALGLVFLGGSVEALVQSQFGLYFGRECGGKRKRRRGRKKNCSRGVPGTRVLHESSPLYQKEVLRERGGGVKPATEHGRTRGLHAETTTVFCDLVQNTVATARCSDLAVWRSRFDAAHLVPRSGETPCPTRRRCIAGPPGISSPR